MGSEVFASAFLLFLPEALRFVQFLDAMPDTKNVIFFDELPWFNIHRSKFLSALGSRNNNLVLAPEHLLGALLATSAIMVNAPPTDQSSPLFLS